MEISAAQVKALREKTGAGVMDCKAALRECNGDLEAAVEQLRKMGRDAAVKRGARTAAEGLVEAFFHPAKPVGALVEVNCETDFVARTDEFQRFVRGMAEHAVHSDLAQGAASLDPGVVLHPDGRKTTVGDMARDASVKLGENIVVRRYARFERSGPGRLEAYIHPGGRVGVLLEVGCSSDEIAEKETFRTLVRDLSMQIAAAAPLTVRREDIDAGLVEKEKAIYREIAVTEGKPEAILDKIVEGRLQKFYKDVALLEQEFVKDQTGKKRTIAGLVKQTATELGGGVEIRRFARFQLGELSGV